MEDPQLDPQCEMDKLSNLIKGRLNHHNLDESATSAEVIFIANQLLAELLPEIKNEIKAYKFTSGVLFITTKNSVLSQEVWGVQEAILKGLKKHFEGMVKKIIIKNLTIE